MNTNSAGSKNKRFTAMAWILALLVLAIAIPVNLIFSRLNFDFDMTPNSLYTLTPTTEAFLDDLDAKGEVVDVYFLTEMQELEGDLEVLALYRTLLAYDAHKCFNLIDFDPDTDPATLRKINPDNVFNLSSGDFLFVHGDTVKRLPATMMYTYKMNEDNTAVLSAEFRAENYFTSYMKTVVEGSLPIVYFLEGHGETGLSEMTRLSANLSNYNYGAKSLNLTTAGTVPEDCCILVIPAPTFDITDAEYDAIYNYTSTGGNLSLLLSPNDTSTTYPNLERLMSGYCIGMRYDRVTESDPNRHSHTDPYAFMCDFAAPNPESEIDLTTALASSAGTLPVYMPYCRSFYSIYGSNYTTLDINNLMISQTTAVSEPWGGTQLDPQRVEGQELVLSMYSMDSLRQNSKMTVFGSADFIADTGVSNAFFIQPLQLFLATVTWMYNSDVDMEIADKARSYDSLNINSDAEASTLIAVFTAFPLLIAAAGVVIWLRRKDA